ncbi:DUF397 domain-containing protein [Streptomyces montanisoli]|uniref:DUF397 domain-containing protein n=1 Tax=Streptomyces montanisoli TaxID=2798581 RepID=A0A940MKL8_9ACTN|nr:DUF397 domain-containing protein [Streptomyces montanisoli]MBP0460233.1 DUF397 domain-containing protein [Streptomyces montanisoli]
MTTTGQIPHDAWRSSTYSGSNGGECVQVADHIPGAVPVRDSKNPGGPVLAFRPSAFAAFVQAVGRGEFTDS